MHRLVERGADVTLALLPDEVVPDFLLEAQADALGLRRTRAPPERIERAPLGDAIAAGLRGVVVAAGEPAVLGKFVDELDGTVDPLRTLALDGPGFARRVDVVAGEPRRLDGGWRLEVGLRGC